MTQEKVITFDQGAQRLVDNGYLPIPIKPGEKFPDLEKGWTSYRFKPDDAEIHAGCGIGLLTGQGEHKVIGIDCDITDFELLQLIYDKLSKMCGGSHKFLSRVGRRPRTLFLVRTDKSFSKVSSHKFLDDRGQEQQLEILANGQQFVAFGRHKVTGQPYSWGTVDRTPLDHPAESLAMVTMEEAQSLVGIVNDYAVKHNWKLKERGGAGRSVSANAGPLTAFDVECMKCRNIPLAEARKIISHIDADAYKDWLEVGMALHLEYDGSDEAFRLWDEWSSKSANYPDKGSKALAEKWASFVEIGKCKEELIRMPTVIAKAEEAKASREKQMRIAAKAEFTAALAKCADEFDVETLARKTSLSNRADREVFTNCALKRLKELGAGSITKTSIQGWFKKSTCSDYAFNELGLAERMRDTYKGGLKWDCINGQWYTWNGIRWKKTPNEAIMGYARMTVEALFDEARGLDSEGAVMLKDFASKCCNPKTWENMLKAFKSFSDGDNSVLISPHELNQNLRYFGVNNGEIDLKTGEFIPGDPAHMITLHSPVNYDKDATCPYIDARMLEICNGDPEIVEFYYDIFGAGMTGRLRRSFLIMFGLGHNGKSALLNLAIKMMGNGQEGYHVGADQKTFIEGKGGSAGGAREDITRLKDKRLVTLVETSDGSRLNSSLVKQLTGGDPMTGRQTWAKSSITFTPCCLPVLVSNHKPIVEDQSEGMWDRLLPVRHLGNFNAERADPLFDQKSEAELSGFLNKCIAGALRFQQRGLRVPEAIRKEQKAYRSAQDPMSDFFSEHCVIEPDARWPRPEAYNAWKQYARDSSVPQYQERKKWFFNAMEERGFETIKFQGTMCFKGIKVKAVGFEAVD